MDKMIKVINDNLRNVINGIKEHRVDLENTLSSIKNEMSLRVQEAGSYKSEVEDARAIISSLEGEIVDLESDLQELQNKFGSKNFKEILNAGNKEINAKIMEKRALINEQGQNILSLTEKARGLKDILIDLREKKVVTEENLDKTKILEGYFESRISEVIRYSEDHPDELESFRDEIPQDELNIQENIDISSIIDGTIFEEIDEISSSEPDAELLESVLANPEGIPVYSSKEDEEVKEEKKEESLSTTDQLENMISEAKSFVEKKQEEVNEQEQENNQEEVLDIYVEDEEKQEETEEPIIDEEEKQVYPDINSIDFGEDPFIDIAGLENELGVAKENEEYEETTDIDTAMDQVAKDIEEDNIDISSVIDVARLNEEDRILIEATADKSGLSKKIDILDKNNINIDNIYKNIKVLTTFNENDFDKLISLLYQCEATNEDIDLVYKYLDKVNVNKLEQVVMSGNIDLTSALGEAFDYDGEEVIGDVLGISKTIANELKRNATAEDFKIMNAMPEIALANYNELKELNIANLNDCLSKYPHRFALAHSKFHQIMDKYDTEDLIRCINKNAAVIDKL